MHICSYVCILANPDVFMTVWLKLYVHIHVSICASKHACYVCITEWLCVPMPVHMYVGMYLWMELSCYVCITVWLCAPMPVHMYVGMYLWMELSCYVCITVWVCVPMPVHMNVGMYLWSLQALEPTAVVAACTVFTSGRWESI